MVTLCFIVLPHWKIRPPWWPEIPLNHIALTLSYYLSYYCRAQAMNQQVWLLEMSYLTRPWMILLTFRTGMLRSADSATISGHHNIYTYIYTRIIYTYIGIHNSIVRWFGVCHFSEIDYYIYWYTLFYFIWSNSYIKWQTFEIFEVRPCNITVGKYTNTLIP